jgi:tetratricopeptide (TPR) repeat protein
MQVSVLNEGHAQYYLGDLLLHMNRLDAAEAPLQQAIALEPKFAASYASLGLLRFRQGKKDEAVKLFAKAVAGDSKNHLAHYYYAHLLEESRDDDAPEARKTRLDLMRTHLRKAIELSPRFVQAYSLLGYVALVSQEGVRDAQDGVLKAIEYAPGRMDLRLMLARLMMLNNDLSAAQSVASLVRDRATDDVIRHQAEQLLGDINNRRQYERDLLAYQEQVRLRRVAAAVADEAPVSDAVQVDRPRLVRRTEERVVATAKVEQREFEGIRIDGLLVAVDCANGVTLRVRANNTIVELHTSKPAEVEFVSYVTAVKDTFECGPTNPEVPVVITYRRTGDRRFLGEPQKIEFVDRR